MFSKIAVAASVASLITALPQSTPTPATDFQLIALKSGDPNIHQANVVANGYGLFLNRDTASYCPTESVDCAAYPGNQTVFSASTTPGTAFMSVVVPGGQQLYVGPDGVVSYTHPHSQDIPEGSLTGPFQYEAPETEGGVGGFLATGTWFACPIDGDGPGKVYQLKVIRQHGSDTKGCTGFGMGAVPVKGGNAWSYT